MLVALSLFQSFGTVITQGNKDVNKSSGSVITQGNKGANKSTRILGEILTMQMFLSVGHTSRLL
jgi:hypothetical protein